MQQTRTPGFDAFASAYDAWYQTPVGRLVDRLEKDAVFALAAPKPGGLALDLSCGTGNYAFALVARGLRVVGVDLSEPMLRVARAKSVGEAIRVRLVRADARTLPFRAATFNLVTMILGLEFVAEPARALAEAHRVLKPGGDLVVAVLNRTGLWTLWRRLKRLIVPSVWRGATFISTDGLRSLLRAGGFAEQRSRSAVHFLPLFTRRGVYWLQRWEAIGARWMPTSATFVAVATRRA